MEISVIIPVYNGAKFLEQTLHSLWQQDSSIAEIIVVDDGSTDRTPELLQELRLRYPKLVIESLHRNMGVSAARNRAVELAASPWCLLWDADDLAKPSLLTAYKRLLHAYERDRMAVDMLFCGSEQIDHSGVVISGQSRFQEIDPSEYLGYLFNRNPIVASSGVLLRKEAYQSAGGCNPEYRYSEDWDLWIRIAQKYAIRYLDQVLVQVRRHTDNASAAIENMIGGEQAVLSQYPIEYIREAIHRRRLPADRNPVDYVSVAYRMGHWEEGYEALEQAPQLTDAVRFYRGLYFLKKERRIEATAEFRIALELNPVHYAARNNLACCLWLEGRRTEAEMHLKMLTQAVPTYMDGSMNLRQLLAGDAPNPRFTWRELRKVLTQYQVSPLT